MPLKIINHRPTNRQSTNHCVDVSQLFRESLLYQIVLQPRSSPTATSSTSTCTESKRPTSPHHRERDRDAPESAPPSKSPRHSPSSPRHETFASASSSEAKPCPTASQAATTCTVSTMKATYYDSKPGCSTESSNPPSPPGATGGAEPNYLDYLPPAGYGKKNLEFVLDCINFRLGTEIICLE